MCRAEVSPTLRTLLGQERPRSGERGERGDESLSAAATAGRGAPVRRFPNTLQSPPGAFNPSLGSQPLPNAATSADRPVSGTVFRAARSQSQARVLASEKRRSSPSPHDVCAAQPGFLRALLAGCRPPPGSGGHGEGRQPLAGGPGRLSDRQQPGGSGEGTRAPSACRRRSWTCVPALETQAERAQRGGRRHGLTPSREGEERPRSRG